MRRSVHSTAGKDERMLCSSMDSHRGTDLSLGDSVGLVYSRNHDVLSSSLLRGPGDQNEATSDSTGKRTTRRVDCVMAGGGGEVYIEILREIRDGL